MKKLNTKITDRLKEEIANFLDHSDVEAPTLCIMKGSVGEETEEKWIYGAYGPENIEKLVPEFRSQGYELLYDIDGLTVAVYQPRLISELGGKTLDSGGDRLILLE